MSNLAVLTNFRHVNLSKNKFTRNGEWAIIDANLEHGDLRPFAAPEPACEDTPAGTKVLYPVPDCCCHSFQHCAEPVKGFCQDQHFHLSETGTLEVATTDELCTRESCTAGSPVPLAPPVATSNCTGQCDSTPVAYVITYVTRNGGLEVEGSPSLPSDLVVGDGHIPNTTVSFDAPPTDDGHCYIAVRVYRIESDFEDGTTNMPIIGGEWALVAEFPAEATTFIDDTPTDETGQPLLTSHPARFPAPTNLVSLTRTENGIAVADANRVYISLPGQPMFSYDGVVQIDDEIKVIRAIGDTIFVLTDNKPVRIEYKHTDGIMDVRRTTTHRSLPLRSRGTVSVYGSELYFASEFSLLVWSIAGYGADIKDALQGVMSREQYHRLDPDSLVGCAYEYGYLLASKKVPYSFMIERIGTDQPTLMPISYVHPDTVTTTHSGKFIYVCNGTTYEWDYRRDICDESDLFDPERSPDCQPFTACLQYASTGKNRFNVARVEWDNRTASHVDFSIHEDHYGNASMLGRYSVVSSRAFGICGYTSSDNHYIEISSCGIVHEVRLGTAYADLVGRSN